MAASSVVRVERNSVLSGTGFVCYSSADEGRCLVMTVADAVGSRRTYHTVGLPNQRADATTAQLLRVDRGANLALLSFVPEPQHRPLVPLEFADGMAADLDSGPVVVRGYYFMGPREILQAPGVFRGDIRGAAVWRGDVHILRCDYTAADGLGGAPVIQAGSVIGVHTGSEGGIQVATSVISVWRTVHAWLGRPNLVLCEAIQAPCCKDGSG